MRTLIKNAYQRHPTLLASTFITIIILKIAALAPPLILGNVIDSLSAPTSPSSISPIYLTIAFSLTGCIPAVINPLQTFLLAKLVQQIVMNASIDWITQLMNKEFLQFESWRIGKFIKSVERGITAHEQLLTFFVIIGIPLLLEFLIVGGAFYYIGGSGVFFVMTCLSATYLLIVHWIIKWRRKHIDAINEHEDELSGALFSTLNTGKAIKLEDASHTAALPLREEFNQYAKSAITVAWSGSFLSSAKTLFLSFSMGGVLGWGVLDQLSGEPSISVGQLVATFSIAGSFLLNITALTEGYRVVDQFLADQRRLKQLLALPNFDEANRLASLKSVQNSKLMLAPCSVRDLQSIRLSVQKNLIFTQGQSVAIIGPSGSGKSTLMEALAGLNAVTRDQLSIDGVSVSRLKARVHLESLRYCPQNPQFLGGTFDRSVLFGVPQSTSLRQAIQRLKLEDVVTQRSVAENASNISGGEAKRLSLLRLINRPGRFNLFDEPSASIEPKLGTPVWDLLFDTFAGRGLICVTHDLDHLYRFDRVIVMQSGTIVEDAPWSELSSKASVMALLKKLDASA